MRHPYPTSAGLPRHLTALFAAALLAAGLGASHGEEGGERAAAEASARWDAELAPVGEAGVSGSATLLRFPGPAPEEPAVWELRLDLAPPEGDRALSPYLRRGTCEAPGRVVVKAEPDANVRGERSTIRIPEHALPSAWIGPHPEERPRPPTPASEALSVEVSGRAGTRVACGELRPAADVAAP